MNQQPKLNSYNPTYWIANPPTEAQIREADRAQRRQIIRWPCGILAATAALFCLLLYGLKVLLFAELSVAFGFISTLLTVVLLPFEDLSVLSKDDCYYALKTFKETREGKAYLNKVREMGREITTFDVEVAKNWAEVKSRLEAEQLKDAACKELYGVK